MVKSLEDMALGERKFLHDISNHLVVAQGMGNIALKNLKQAEENVSVDQKAIDRLEKSVKAIDKMIVLVKERRHVLHSLS